MALVVAGQVRASEFYYVVFNIPPLADVHFPSPNAACQSAYQYDQSVTFKAWAGDEELEPLPYEAPHIFQSFPPKLLKYQCDTSAKVTYRDENGNITGTYTLMNGYYINRQGNDCKDGQYYNPVTGYCQTSDQEQANKELGNPEHLVGTVSCADPINIGTGNVFEQETDYADQDGELSFSRTDLAPDFRIP
ncbi:hypothetical protein [Luteibacter sp.]|uniref:hypothetical protein n=1 Tax=Luteibacter sp. TaxID=1886636 RepID=UPI002F3E91BE